MVSEKNIFLGFSHYNHMGAIRCPGNQSSYLIWSEKILQPFPLPNGALDKIWLQSVHWLRRYSCLKMLTLIHIDTQTQRRRIDWYTI